MLLANFNGKEHLRHRAVSLRQHGFLVYDTVTWASQLGGLCYRNKVNVTIMYTRGVKSKVLPLASRVHIASLIFVFVALSQMPADAAWLVHSVVCPFTPSFSRYSLIDPGGTAHQVGVKDENFVNTDDMTVILPRVINNVVHIGICRGSHFERRADIGGGKDEDN